jgi:hypothetical protein
MIADVFYCLLTIGNRSNVVPFQAQDVTQRLAGNRFVVNDKNVIFHEEVSLC